MLRDDLLEAALAYADLGFRVFPLAVGQKTPATERGVLDATDDASLIEEAWGNQPFNIGLATGGLVVVDIDGAGNPWLSTLGERAYDMMAGPICRTPRGGSHRYFRQPAEGDYRNTASTVAPGVDTRADGGYVVAPPSVLEAGGGYQWMPEFELTADLGEPPPWLLEKLRRGAGRTAPAVRIESTTTTAGNPIPSGQRNHALASIAGAMRRYGLSQAEILASLHVVNCSRCQPPLAASEVEKIAESISRYQPDQIATGAVEGDYYRLNGAKQVEPFPVELLRPPGFLSQVIDYNLAGAYRQQPILALAGALALLATITGRKVCDEANTRTNLFIIGVGGSGCGKDRARVVNKELLFQAGARALVGPESPASATGIVSAVSHQPAILFQWDEIGRLLQTMSGKFVSPNLANISTVLMKMFTSSASVYFGDAYADADRNKEINSPHVVLYGTTVPKNLYENLSADSVSDGFLGRMLIFESETPHPDYQETIITDCEPIVATIREWVDKSTGGNLAGENPQPTILPTNEGAAKIWRQFRDECLELERAALDNAPLWTRAVEKGRKLALLHACSRGASEIGAGDANWGRSLAMYLTERLSGVGQDWIAKSHADGNRQEIARWLRDRPLQASTLSEMARGIRRLSKKERESAIVELEEMGLLVCWEEETGGRRVRKVRAVSQDLSSRSPEALSRNPPALAPPDD